MKHPHLSLVVDDVLMQAKTAAHRQTAEAHAVKIAAAQPKTELGRSLRALADHVRTSHDVLTYADFAGVL